MARKEIKMRFYHNEGEAKYLVSLHYWNGDDKHYFDNYADAAVFFKKTEQGYAGKPHETVSMSLYDLKKDVRKMFVRIGAEA